MYFRAVILSGDTTTSHGEVRVPPSTITASPPARDISFEGSPVYCPACKSMGVTKCVLPFRPWTNPDKRQVNLDGDLCICKCPKPPRLKASRVTPRMDFEAHEIAQMPGAMDWLAYAGHAPELTRYDQFFLVMDKATNAPISGFSYGIQTKSGEHHDTLYNDGATAKAYASEPQDMALNYLVQTQMEVRP